MKCLKNQNDFTLKSSELTTVNGMLQYCSAFGFCLGASEDLMRFLFSAAEKEVPPDKEVVMDFIALENYTSPRQEGHYCAVVFSATKVIVSGQRGCTVVPVVDIVGFSCKPGAERAVICMEEKRGLHYFGVEAEKASTICELCIMSLENCKKEILETNRN